MKSSTTPKVKSNIPPTSVLVINRTPLLTLSHSNLDFLHVHTSLEKEVVLPVLSITSQVFTSSLPPSSSLLVVLKLRLPSIISFKPNFSPKKTTMNSTNGSRHNKPSSAKKLMMKMPRLLVKMLLLIMEMVLLLLLMLVQNLLSKVLHQQLIPSSSQEVLIMLKTSRMFTWELLILLQLKSKSTKKPTSFVTRLMILPMTSPTKISSPKLLSSVMTRPSASKC